MVNFFKKIFSSEGKEKDLVCGMSVDVKIAQHKSHYQDKLYFFCSEHCKKQFNEDPSSYMDK